MQQQETPNTRYLQETRKIPFGRRLLAIDPGTKRIGVAVCDPQRITVTPLPIIHRRSWKDLLAKIRELLTEFDAAALVVGLPFNFDGSESEMSAEARRLAEKFSLSLDVPVILQDERATTYEARRRMWLRNADPEKMRETLDSEAAAVILGDLISRLDPPPDD